MPTDKRQRHKEGRQARREAAMAEAKRRQRRRRIVQIAALTVAVVAVVLLVSVLGGDDSTDVATDESTSTTAATDAGEPAECERADADGADADTSTKPDVAVPEAPPTELECTDIVVGDGDEAALGDTIEVHYVGVKQSDGEQFDASWDNGEPVEFPLVEGGLIKGWTDGIPGMKVGGRRELVIPSDLAYGPTGRAPQIGPDESLVFIVDLVSVEKA